MIEIDDVAALHAELHAKDYPFLNPGTGPGPGDGREMGWEFVPGVHWRLSDNFWMSLGAARRGMFTCSWQF